MAAVLQTLEFAILLYQAAQDGMDQTLIIRMEVSYG